jgi:hypothetical protein
VARYLKPCEKAIYRLRGDGKVLPSTRVIGKGLCMTERGNLLRNKLRAFNKPKILSLDASRFDQHVDVKLLEIEHSFYTHMCSDPWFAQLLSWQLVNHGVSSKGIRYTTLGKRMSGDMNTALGNCLLMVLMVSTFMVGRKYDMLDDGDDCLLIIEEEDLNWVVDNIHSEFLSYGHEIKIDNVADVMEGVQWCQGKPVEYKVGQYKFVRDVNKVLSSSLIGVKYIDNAGSRRKLVNSIGMGELILNLGIPVLQEYALSLMRNADTNQFIRLDETDASYFRLHRELKRMNMKCLARVEPKPISAVARLSFSEAFGIDIPTQLMLENFLRTWKINFSGCELIPEDLDPFTWSVNSLYTSEVTPIWE